MGTFSTTVRKRDLNPRGRKTPLGSHENPAFRRGRWRTAKLTATRGCVSNDGTEVSTRLPSNNRCCCHRHSKCWEGAWDQTGEERARLSPRTHASVENLTRACFITRASIGAGKESGRLMSPLPPFQPATLGIFHSLETGSKWKGKRTRCVSTSADLRWIYWLPPSWWWTTQHLSVTAYFPRQQTTRFILLKGYLGNKSLRKSSNQQEEKRSYKIIASGGWNCRPWTARISLDSCNNPPVQNPRDAFPSWESLSCSALVKYFQKCSSPTTAPERLSTARLSCPRCDTAPAGLPQNTLELFTA